MLEQILTTGVTIASPPREAGGSDSSGIVNAKFGDGREPAGARQKPGEKHSVVERDSQREWASGVTDERNGTGLAREPTQTHDTIQRATRMPQKARYQQEGTAEHG